MSPTKLLLGQIVVVLAIVVLGIWFATQWAAARSGYQPELGQPWFILFDIAIHRPWSIFAYIEFPAALGQGKRRHSSWSARKGRSNSSTSGSTAISTSSTGCSTRPNFSSG